MLGWGQGAVSILNDGDDIGGGSRPSGFNKEDALVLAAAAAAALIADDADGGDGGVSVVDGVLGDAFARAGTVGASGAGMTTMGSDGGDYADPGREILHDDGRHPLSPPWRIRHGNHSCSRQMAMARADGFAATHSNDTTQLFRARHSKQAREGGTAGILISHATTDDGDGHLPLPAVFVDSRMLEHGLHGGVVHCYRTCSIV
jgi:hypothetical protein